MWPTIWTNRWSASPFDELRRQMDRLLDDFNVGPARPSLLSRAAYPALNVWDAGDALCVEAELPGVDKGDVEIYAVGNELTIKGRRAAVNGEKRTYHRQERLCGQFTRVVTVPTEFDTERVDAVLKDGVLSVRLPKAESAKPRKIAVQTND